MSSIKRYMDLQREEDELIEKLKNVMDYLEDQPAAQGITKQIIGKGFNSLSENQTLVFERYIHPVINQYHSNWPAVTVRASWGHFGKFQTGNLPIISSYSV